ncbi:MAG TPA: Wzz/FepE/Etk N-terminal domain-containing protein [Telluria sp.]
MSEQTLHEVQPGTDVVAKEKVNFLDLLIILGRSKKLVIGLPLVTGLLAMGVSLMIPPVFTSTAKIMPPQQQQSSSVASMLGQIGALAGAAGGIKSPNDMYVGLLQSRTVADNLIKRFDLAARYKTRTMDDTRAALAGITAVGSDRKSGFISISAEDKDPKFAATLANAYVDELARLTQSMALTEASQRRLFFEKQLKDAKEQLSIAEIALRKTQEKTGMLQPDVQVQAIITNAAQLKGAIAAKQVEINAMRTFAAGRNPELLRAQEELRGLQAQVAQLERRGLSGDGDFMVPTGKIPEVGVEYVRKLRDIKYYETIFELLAKQFELAKVDEARESTLIQVLDQAVEAERKTRPRRAIITLAGAFAGALLGVVLVLGRAGYRASRGDPLHAHRWERVSAAWSLRRQAR